MQQQLAEKYAKSYVELPETFWSFSCLGNWLCHQTGPVCLLSSSSGSASGACCLFLSHMVKMQFKECNFVHLAQSCKTCCSCFTRPISRNLNKSGEFSNRVWFNYRRKNKVVWKLLMSEPPARKRNLLKILSYLYDVVCPCFTANKLQSSWHYVSSSKWQTGLNRWI